eukprot:1158489-Pelagomonas_calceolata.AAC.3
MLRATALAAVAWSAPHRRMTPQPRPPPPNQHLVRAESKASPPKSTVLMSWLIRRVGIRGPPSYGRTSHIAWPCFVSNQWLADARQVYGGDVARTGRMQAAIVCA